MGLQKLQFDWARNGPLDGLRVLDFSRLVAGNMVSLQLADLGAEVVKVEAPGRGDTLRDWREKGLSVHWKVYARNKKSITLDLKSPEAPGIILDLAARFDVMIESFRYRYLERLGVGPDALLARNPTLVLVRVSGFGQTGPYAKRPGFGTLVEAMSGFASRNGFEDREPVLPPLAMADMIAGLYGALATVVAVRDIERNGGAGQGIDVSLLDAIVGDFIGQRTLAENIAFFEEAGVTAGPVYDIAQFLDDPHVQARGIVVDAPDDEMGETPMHAPVPRLSRTPGVLRAPAPALGQHNDEIYARIGYSPERRADLR